MSALKNSFARRVFASIGSLITVLYVISPVLAAEPSHSSGRAGASNSLNMDLGSTERTLSAGQFFNSRQSASAPSSLVIQTGQLQRTVTSTSLLTPAELVAIYQVARTGHQSLSLSQQGNAVAGTFNLTARLAQRINNLVITDGVMALGNVSASRSLDVKGNLTNAGQLLLFSSNPAIQSAVLNATNITNMQSGLITTNINYYNLAARNDLVGNLGLTLNAVNNISNAGTISSAGNLTMSAGGSITNAGLSGASGPTPVMQAAANLSMTANNVVNAGLIGSTAGNISVQAHGAHNLLVSNTGGALQALNGQINIGAPSVTDKVNLNVTGGDLLSRQVNLHSGNGIVDVSVNKISGIVNVNASEAHVQAATPDLKLGDIRLTGDPTFYNSNGDVCIYGSLVFNGQHLAIVASGNIKTMPGATGPINIDTSSTTGNGGNITMVAGAQFTTTGPSSVSPNQSGGPSAGDTQSILTIAGPSATGGLIDLACVGCAPVNSIVSSSSASGGTGGNITLVAYGGTMVNSMIPGVISLPASAPINASGSGSGGKVLIISGSTYNSTMTLGPIDVSSPNSTNPTNTVTIATATPTLPNGNVSIQNGAIINGATFGIGSGRQGSVVLAGIAGSGSQSVSIQAGSVAQLGTLTVNGPISSKIVNLQAGSGMTLNSNITGVGSSGSVTLAVTGAGSISQSNFSVLTAASNVILSSAGGNIGSNAIPINLQAAGLAANTSGSGNVYINNTGNLWTGASSAGGVFQIVNSASITVNGSMNASSIVLQAVGVNAISQANSSAVLTASNLIVSSGGGNIGSVASPLKMQAAGFAANTSGFGSVYLSNTGSVWIGTSGAGANGGVFSLTNNGSMTVNGNISAANISLSAVGVSAIAQASTSAVMTAGNLVLSSGGGHIGSSTNPIRTAAGAMSANTSGFGNVYISNSATSLWTGASSAGSSGGVFSLTTSGVLSLNGSITATNIGLSATGVSEIIQANPSSILTASNLTLASGGGSIGRSTSPILIQAGAMSATTSGVGNVFISSSGNLWVGAGGAGVSGGIFNLTSTGAIVLNGQITATYISLNAVGAAAITQANSSSYLQSSNLTLSSGGGSIGTPSNPVLTAAAALAANTSGSGAVYLTNNGAVMVGQSAAGGLFQLTSVGNMNIVANVTGSSVSLLTQAGGAVSINGTVTTTGSAGTVNVNAQGSITVSTGYLGNAYAVNLTSGSSIGTSSVSARLQNAANAAISAQGNAYVYDSVPAAVTVNITSASAGGDLQFSTSGHLSTTGPVSGGSIKLQSNGMISLGSSVQAGGVAAVNASWHLTVNGHVQGTIVSMSSVGPMTINNTVYAPYFIILQAQGNVSINNSLISDRAVQIDATGTVTGTNLIVTAANMAKVTQNESLSTFQAAQQIFNVMLKNYPTWFGGYQYSALNLLPLMTNQSITGPEAAVIGLLADYRYLGNNLLNFGQTVELFSPADYNVAMQTLASAGGDNGTFSLYGSYSGPTLLQMTSNPQNVLGPAGPAQSILQQNIGDCFFIAAVEALMNINPQAIKNMITQTGGRTFTVNFPNGPQQMVTLTQAEVVALSNPAYNNGAWLAVLGMATSQQLLTQPRVTPTGITPLDGIAWGGNPAETFTLLNGQQYSNFLILSQTENSMNVQQITNILNTAAAAHLPLGISSNNHELAVMSFTPANNTVTLLNPWGVSGVYSGVSSVGDRYTVFGLTMNAGLISLTTTTLANYFLTIQAPSTMNQGVPPFTRFDQSGVITTVVPTSGTAQTMPPVVVRGQNLSVINGLFSPPVSASFASPAASSNLLTNLIPSVLQNELHNRLSMPDASARTIVRSSATENPDIAGQSDDLLPISFTHRAAPTTVLNAHCTRKTSLLADETFLHSLDDTVIDARLAEVKVRKGALVSVTLDDDAVRVIACSGPGHIRVKVGAEEISLSPGREITISARPLSPLERQRADGIGRRDFHSYSLSNGLFVTTADVSLVSLLANGKHLRSLLHPASVIETRIAKRMIKTSVVLQHVTAYKGAYEARESPYCRKR